nr:hypothetical protein [Tanacetum cinerariifolium]
TTCCRRRRVSPKKPSDAVELLVLPEKSVAATLYIPVIFLVLLLVRDFTVFVATVAWAAPPLPPPPSPSPPPPSPSPPPPSPPPPNLLLCNLKFVGNL